LESEHSGERPKVHLTRGPSEQTRVDPGVYELEAQRAERETYPTLPRVTGSEARRPAPAPQPEWGEEDRADRWPSLPEQAFPTAEAEDALIEEEWEVQRRRRQRIQRLDEEQKGNPWSASPF
jgi:hypothetical protein